MNRNDLIELAAAIAAVCLPLAAYAMAVPR